MKTQQILLTAICILSLINIAIGLMHSNEKDLQKELKQQALMLMLQAEKQGLDNPEKFKYVVNKIYNKSPEVLRKAIKEETIEEWVSNIYNSYKSYIQTQSTK